MSHQILCKRKFNKTCILESKPNIEETHKYGLFHVYTVMGAVMQAKKSRMAMTLALALLIFCFVGLSYSQNIGVPIALKTQSNVILENFSIFNYVGTNAPLSLSVGIRNNGGYATGNITIDSKINGPANYQDNYTIPALASEQNETLTISKNNRTVVPGNYSMVVTAVYGSNGTTKYSNMMQADNKVAQLFPYQPSSNASIAMFSANGIAIVYLPVYSEYLKEAILLPN